MIQLLVGMSFTGESLKSWVRGHKEAGGDKTETDVILVPLGTS